MARRKIWVSVFGLACACIFISTLHARQSASAASSPLNPLTPVKVPVEEQSLLPLIESVFKTAAAGDVDAAVQHFSDRAWRENQRSIDQFRATLTNLNQVATGYDGTELVAVRRVSPRLTEVWTISWFEPGPYLFKARFYLKDGEWCFADWAGTNEMNEVVDKAPLTFVARYEAP